MRFNDSEVESRGNMDGDGMTQNGLRLLPLTNQRTVGRCLSAGQTLSQSHLSKNTYNDTQTMSFQDR